GDGHGADARHRGAGAADAGLGGQPEGDRAHPDRGGEAVGGAAIGWSAAVPAATAGRLARRRWRTGGTPARCGRDARTPGGAPMIFALLLAITSATPPDLPGKVAIAQHLGAQLPLDVMLRDESGRVVRLGDYFNHGRP